MKWDLFVDESGNFNRGEAGIIGGFICPSRNYNPEVAAQWHREIKNELVNSGLVTAQELQNGDLLSMIQKRDGRRNRPVFDNARNALRGQYYVFDHCSENEGGETRWNRQKFVLNKIKEKLNTINAKIVIFDNPAKVFNVDNNTTYLTVLLRGVMLLFERLEEQDGHPEICIHAAERSNRTLYEEDISVSPTRVPGGNAEQQGVLIKVQYANQLKNMALLYGGAQLATHPSIMQMLEKIEIIKDLDATSQTGTISLLNAIKARKNIVCDDFLATQNLRLSNPITMSCDYISNCYFAIHNNGHVANRILRDCYNTNDSIIIDAFANMSATDYTMDSLLRNQNYAAAWPMLIDSGFPARETERFFSSIKGNPSFATALVAITDEYFKPFVQGQNDMEYVLQRLQSVLDMADRFPADVSNPIKASLYLYQKSQYTHMGDSANVLRVNELFLQHASKITDTAYKNNLMEKNFNRRIVSYTDDFDYYNAAECFVFADLFWEAQARANIFDDEPKPYEGYGKTIGSYLQLLAHRLRSTGGGVDNENYLEAKNFYQKARNNLVKQDDICRHYQNLCFVEWEAGNIEEGFRYLYYASDPLKLENDEGAFSTEKCKKVLEIADQNAYLFLVYVRLCCEALRRDENSQIGTEMLRTLLENHPFHNAYGNCFPSVHPNIRWRIRWRAAYAVCMCGLRPHEHTTVIGALNSVYNDCMKNGEKLFICFAVAIKSEEIFLAYSGKLSATEKQIDQWKQELLNAYNNVKNKGGIDPFAGLITPESITEKEKLKKITQKIAY